jgi:hypothetical protein
MAITQARVRRGLSTDWVANNPVLGFGTIGIVTDTGLFKVGDGVTRWNSLAYPTETGSVPTTLTLSSGVASQPNPVESCMVYVPLTGGASGAYTVAIGPTAACAYTLFSSLALGTGQSEALQVELPEGWYLMVTQAAGTITIGTATQVPR